MSGRFRNIRWATPRASSASKPCCPIFLDYGSLEIICAAFHSAIALSMPSAWRLKLTEPLLYGEREPGYARVQRAVMDCSPLSNERRLNPIDIESLCFQSLRLIPETARLEARV